MNQRVSFRSLAALTMILVLTALSSPVSAVQKKDKKQKATPKGTPVLWRAHRDVASLDLFHGPREALRPDSRRDFPSRNRRLLPPYP